MNPGIVYRSCDRPKYVERTLPLLLQRTSPETPIVVYDNSSLDERRDSVAAAIATALSGHQEGRPVIVHHSNEARIGGTMALKNGVDILREEFEVDSILVVDDDVAVPREVEGVTWDQVLTRMLDAGWQIVAHPWSSDFRSKDTIEIGGVPGYPYGGVNGGCSAFSLDFYNQHPMKQISAIRGYNEWMVRWSENNCGYSHECLMVFEHIDRPEHPWSLRDTEYDEWSNEMFYERFPNRRGQVRPKGPKGVW